MTAEAFDREISRLKTEWPDSYGAARKLALWEIYRDLPEDVFREAVSALLLNGGKYPPRMKEFEEAVEHARLAWKQRQWSRPIRPVTAKDEPAPDLNRVRKMVQWVLGRRAGEKPPESLLGIPMPKPVSGRDRAAGERDDD